MTPEEFAELRRDVELRAAVVSESLEEHRRRVRERRREIARYLGYDLDPPPPLGAEDVGDCVANAVTPERDASPPAGD